MKKLYFAILLALLLSITTLKGQQETSVLLRADDFGMSHAVNLALKDLIETGIPFNASVMMVAPWVQEAADLLKDAPQVSIGLHLTLTSEFEQLKWGPISGKQTVPSLVDNRGFFQTSVKDFLLSDYKLEEVETELRAQIERAYAMGMKVDYLDHHMGIARSTPEIAAVVEKLASEYGLAIARYFNENLGADVWGSPIDKKGSEVLSKLNDLAENRINLFVFHVAHDNVEISELNDLNTNLMSDPGTGHSILAKHRSAELQVFLSNDFKEALKNKKLITYGDLKETKLSEMKRGSILFKSIADAKQSFDAP